MVSDAVPGPAHSSWCRSCCHYYPRLAMGKPRLRDPPPSLCWTVSEQSPSPVPRPLFRSWTGSGALRTPGPPPALLLAAGLFLDHRPGLLEPTLPAPGAHVEPCRLDRWWGRPEEWQLLLWAILPHPRRPAVQLPAGPLPFHTGELPTARLGAAQTHLRAGLG